jgi:hypothetical protein
MDADSTLRCNLRASHDMAQEAEMIAGGLKSPSFTQPQEALERLRCDFFNLPDAQLLELHSNLQGSAEKRGLANPLSRIPETVQNGFNKLTGEEIVVLTNPFDDKVEMSRLSHEQSFDKDKGKILLFETRYSSMVDHRANVYAYDKERMLRSPRHDE